MMRKSLHTMLLLLMVLPLAAQQSRMASDAQRESLLPIQYDLFQEPVGLPETQAIPNDDPVGTIITDAVTSVKIGASSNAFTFLVGQNVQLSVVQATDGDAIGFIYRQNIADCGGSASENGLYRYSYSSDGGATWKVGPAGTSSSGTAPAGCYGFGVMNPSGTRLGRYPNFLLSQATGGNTLADIKGVYAGAALDPAYPAVTDWDGSITGTVSAAATASPVFSPEDYYFGGNDQYLPYHLTERVPGEYWFVSRTYDAGASSPVGNVLKINKGLYNASTGKVDWVNDYTVAGPGGSVIHNMTSPTIAFSPDGMTGYVAYNGDIGFQDSAYHPVFLKTTDGGNTWSDPEEVNLGQFGELSQLLQSFWITIDTTTGDTIPVGSGIPTTAFEHDLVVDQNGNPHFICAVGNASTNTTTPAYSIYSGLRKYILDVTIDSYGDYNCIVLADLLTFRGTFGPTGDEVTADAFVQASRSADGSRVFFSWADSDTTGNFGNSDNNNPNFITRGLDVDNMKLTTIDNRTLSDLNWASRAIMPRTAPVVLDDGQGNYTIPTAVMDLPPGASPSNPVSFWYFSDITYADADFTEDVEFFYSCSQNPFANSVSATAPGCGLSDGTLTVNPSGGLGGYSYQWGAAAGSVTTQTASGLPAGLYEVTITDSVGCSETILTTLNDANAPTLVIDSTANISCFGAGNGYAEVNATPASGATVTSYLWSNGETSAVAMMLPSGNNSVVVTDDQNCSSTTFVTISEPSDISLSATGVGVGCYGDATGSATARASGGTGNLSFSWSNGGTTAAISGVTAGSYTVTVTDENGCTTNTAVAVSQPDSLALDLTSSPNSATTPPYVGFANAEYSGGTDPVTFQWTGPGGFSDNKKLIFSLPGGMYVCTATDGNGCVTVDSVMVEGPGISTIGIEDELSAGIQMMSIVPNPNNGQFAVQLDLAGADDVRIDVLNLNGQVVASVQERNALQVKQSFDLSHQASGVYMVQVTTSHGTAGRKVVVR